MHRPAAYELLLFLINGVQWTPHFFVPPGLHLCENKGVAITTDQIDFATSRRAEVPPEDLPTKPIQMTCGSFLTPLAQSYMVRIRRWAGRPAQNHVDDAGKVHAHEA